MSGPPVPAGELRLVHLLSGADVSERVRGFHAAVELLAPGEVLLVADAVLLEDRAAREPPLAPDEGPTVVLDADRWEVMDLLTRFPIAAAIEKYALFMWWKNRGRVPGAFWIHGETRLAERLGPDIVLSPLYRSEAHCAFGSASAPGLPALLARYLDAWARDRG